MDSISKPVDEYFHLPRDMIDIDWRAEHDSIGVSHPLIEKWEIIGMHALACQRTTLASRAGFDPEAGQVDKLGLCPCCRGAGKNPLQELAGPAPYLAGAPTDAEDSEVLARAGHALYHCLNGTSLHDRS